MQTIIELREKELALAMQNRGKWGGIKNHQIELEIERLRKEIADLEAQWNPVVNIKKELYNK